MKTIPITKVKQHKIKRKLISAFTTLIFVASLLVVFPMTNVADAATSNFTITPSDPISGASGSMVSITPSYYVTDMCDAFTVSDNIDPFIGKLTVTIRNTTVTDGTYTYNAGTIVQDETTINDSSATPTTIDLSSFGEGAYLVTVKAYTSDGSDYDTGYIIADIVKVTASAGITPNVNNPSDTYNPAGLNVGSDHAAATDAGYAATLEWTITDSNGTEIASGTSQDDLTAFVASDAYKDLPEGTYTLTNTATVGTILSGGTDTVSNTAQTDFQIRHPQSTITVDNVENPTDTTVNPTSITGTQHISAGDGSVLTWTIPDPDNPNGPPLYQFDGTNILDAQGHTVYSLNSNGTFVDSDGKQVLDAAGNPVGSNAVPPEVIDALAAGTYTVTYTETSPEGETSDSSATIELDDPQASVTIDNTKDPTATTVNPTSISGGKKLDDSSSTWEIKDSDGNVVESGSFASDATDMSIPEDVLEGLSDGDYTVTFTEVSTTRNKTSTVSAPFTITSPDTTSSTSSSSSSTSSGSSSSKSTSSGSSSSSSTSSSSTSSGSSSSKSTSSGSSSSKSTSSGSSSSKSTSSNSSSSKSPSFGTSASPTSSANTVTVTVHYVDTNGDPLQTSTVASVGSGYAYRVDNPSLLTINGVVYQVTAVTGDPLNGSATQNENITFVLTPQPAAAALNGSSTSTPSSRVNVNVTPNTPEATSNPKTGDNSPSPVLPLGVGLGAATLSATLWIRRKKRS